MIENLTLGRLEAVRQGHRNNPQIPTGELYTDHSDITTRMRPCGFLVFESVVGILTPTLTEREVEGRFVNPGVKGKIREWWSGGRSLASGLYHSETDIVYWISGIRGRQELKFVASLKWEMPNRSAPCSRIGLFESDEAYNRKREAEAALQTKWSARDSGITRRSQEFLKEYPLVDLFIGDLESAGLSLAEAGFVSEREGKPTFYTSHYDPYLVVLDDGTSIRIKHTKFRIEKGIALPTTPAEVLQAMETVGHVTSLAYWGVMDLSDQAHCYPRRGNRVL